MEMTARIQFETGDIESAITNLNKSTKARWKVIETWQIIGYNADEEIRPLFFDFINVASIQIDKGNMEQAVIAANGARELMTAYPELLDKPEERMNLMQVLESLR